MITYDYTRMALNLYYCGGAATTTLSPLGLSPPER